MHNSLDKLFASARQATPPALDITDRVCETLRSGRSVRLSDKPLWVAASISLAAAAAVLLLVFAQNATIQDPFVQWLTSYAVALS
jgi:hypothetical protein